jgi:hypothetical protein
MLQFNDFLEGLLDLAQSMLCDTISQIDEVRHITAGVTEVAPSSVHLRNMFP